MPSSFHVVVLVNLTAFHHEPYVLQSPHIPEWIAVNGHQVCPLAGFDGSDLVTPTEQVRGIDGGCLDGCERRESSLHHGIELTSVQTMRIHPRIRSKGHLYAALQSVGYVLLGGRQDFLCFDDEKRRQMEGLHVFEEKIAGVQGRHKISAVLLNGCDVLIVDKGAMLNRIRAGFSRPEDGL